VSKNLSRAWSRAICALVVGAAAATLCPPVAGAVSFTSGTSYSLPDPSAPFNSPSYGGVAIGDLGGDGKPEIMVPRENGAGNVWVFPNHGDGTFSAATPHAGCAARYPVFGRRTSDGSPFLVQLCTSGQFDLLPGDGHGGFGTSTPSQPIVNPLPWPQIGNLDGAQDLVFATGSGISSTFCLLEIANFGGTPNCDGNGDVQNRAGQFVLASIFPASRNLPQRIVDLADANNFGFAGYDQTPTPGWDAFTKRFASPDNGWLVAAGDLNGDGVDDVAVANIGSSTHTPGTLYTMLAQAGTGGFAVGDRGLSAGTAIPDPSFMQLADFNGDGKLDAIVAGTDSTGTGGNPEFAIMLGRGDGQFDPAQLFGTGFSPNSTAWWLGVADLDGDTKPDVVIANGDEQTVRVFMNTTATVPGGGPGGGGPPGRPAGAKIGSLHATARKFRIGSLPAHFARHVAVGATFSFTLDRAARVTFSFTKLLPGKRSGRRCVAPRPKLKHARSCTRRPRAGSLAFNATAGAHKLFFDGRLQARKTLPPGRYELAVTATTGGITSAAKKLLLTLLPPLR
jgi:FG-GAP-like repeat/FG-GAP repeat